MLSHHVSSAFTRIVFFTSTGQAGSALSLAATGHWPCMQRSAFGEQKLGALRMRRVVFFMSLFVWVLLCFIRFPSMLAFQIDFLCLFFRPFRPFLCLPLFMRFHTRQYYAVIAVCANLFLLPLSSACMIPTTQ